MLSLIARLLVLFVAVLHAWFLVLEMFLWTKPLGLKTFQMTAERAQETSVLAANQGLYNGFLAAGLVWAALSNDGFSLRLFFLGCVLVAGLYGGYSVKPTIFMVQGVPALLALAVCFAAR